MRAAADAMDVDCRETPSEGRVNGVYAFDVATDLAGAFEVGTLALGFEPGAREAFSAVLFTGRTDIPEPLGGGALDDMAEDSAFGSHCRGGRCWRVEICSYTIGREDD